MNRVNIGHELLLWPKGAPGAMGKTAEDQPSLELYLVESDRPKGMVMICPGGGYSTRAFHEGQPIALWLNSIGVSAAVLRYRVYPYRHPYPLMDAQRAIRTLRHYRQDIHIDPDRIAVLGFSAGGHLASTLGTHYDGGLPNAEDPIERQGCRPNAMVLCYPVISFMEEWTHSGSRSNLIGDDAEENLRILLSNERQITADTPPAFIWHTADDAVAVENSLYFAKGLSRCKVPFEIHVYSSGPHGLGLAEQIPHIATWTQLCAEWFETIGFMK